jgi:gas vesicle protein
MFKRLFWLMVGAGFGFGVSFWLMRFVKEKAARYTPERVSSDLASALKGFGQDLKDAVADGRAAMQEREAELRGEAEGRATLRLVGERRSR